MADKPSIAKKDSYDKWEIEGWARTLREAETIKNDPKKMKLLAPYLKKEIASLDALKELIATKGSMDDEMEDKMGA